MTALCPGAFAQGAPTPAPVQAAAAEPSAEAATQKKKDAAKTKTAKAAPGEGGRPVQSIVVLVNDEPITGYEVEQRVTLAMLGANDVQRKLQAKLKSPGINEQFKAFAMKRLQANPPKTEAEQQARIKQLQGEFVESLQKQVRSEYSPQARKQALDELIDERLKMQEAKRLNIVAGDDEVDRIIAGMAERNKMTPPQFAEHMRKMGSDIGVMKARIRASMSWSDVVKRKYGHMITVASREVDRMVAGVEGQDSVDLRLSRILFSLPGNLDQKLVAQRLGDAERLRTKFTGCSSMEQLARQAGGARYDYLGDRRPTSIPEPTRSLLLNAHDDEMLPATIGEQGVELWAVCGRKVVKAEETKRETAQNEIRQKEFEVLSKKALKDLRQDAHIEYR